MVAIHGQNWCPPCAFLCFTCTQHGKRLHTFGFREMGVSHAWAILLIVTRANAAALPAQDGWVGNYTSSGYHDSGCSGPPTSNLWISAAWQESDADCMCSFGKLNDQYIWFEQCYAPYCAGGTMTQKLCQAPGCQLCTPQGTFRFVGGFPAKKPPIDVCIDLWFTPEGSTTPIALSSKGASITTASGNASAIFPC